jgi:PKD repeat protein
MLMPGIYSVTLITSNQLGCTDTVSVADYIEVKSNPVPVIKSSTGLLQKCAPVNATFSSHNSKHQLHGHGILETQPHPSFPIHIMPTVMPGITYSGAGSDLF